MLLNGRVVSVATLPVMVSRLGWNRGSNLRKSAVNRVLISVYYFFRVSLYLEEVADEHLVNT